MVASPMAAAATMLTLRFVMIDPPAVGSRRLSKAGGGGVKIFGGAALVWTPKAFRVSIWDGSEDRRSLSARHRADLW